MASMNDDNSQKVESAEPSSKAAEKGDLAEWDPPFSGQGDLQVSEADISEPAEVEMDDSDDDVDPADEIAAFDWEDLHERYHKAIGNASAQEQQLLQEFSQLMNYFRIWADAGANQESDRTFHRLRTRMTYIQNSEEKLEKTRQHYIGVVQAFESALALLRNSGFGG